jgi:uncharacterized membrane protein YkoI
MKRLVLAAAFVVFAVPAGAQEENAITMEEAPQAAKDAAMSHADGVTFETVQIDNDQGTETYEFAGKMANGMQIEVDVLADGSLEEIEEQIEVSAVPPEVMATLEQNLAGFKPEMAEKSTRPDNLVVYEFEGTHDGKEIDVEINADGSNYTSNEDTAG